MLTNGWLEVEMARMAHESDVDRAEQARLTQLITAKRSTRFAQLRRTTARWLVAAGQRLQPPAPMHEAHEL